MTALSLIVMPNAAHIVADRGWIDRDGVIVKIQSKIAMHGDLRMAIGQTGLARDDQTELIEEWLSSQTSQDNALAAMSDLLARLAGEVDRIRDREGFDGKLSVITLAVAIWSTVLDRPMGYVITSGAGHLPAAVKPYTLRQTPEYIQPPLSAFPSPRTRSEFVPAVHGRDLVEHQRLQPVADGRRIIGCGADCATISREGVRLERICTWPDAIRCKIGERRSRRKLLGLF